MGHCRASPTVILEQFPTLYAFHHTKHHLAVDEIRSYFTRSHERHLRAMVGSPQHKGITMIVFRLIGLVLILLAVIAFVVDGTKSLAENKLVITALGQHWFNLHPSSLNTLQAAIERNVNPFLWDPVVFTIIQWPAWAVLVVLGLLFYWIGRRRRKTDAFIN